MSNCKVIALCNQKGGVGKTTTTANLGIGLAMQGKKVLLIDADAQASLTLSLGFRKPDELPVTLPKIMKGIIEGNKIPVNEGILRHKEGVDLIPSNISLSGIDANELPKVKNNRYNILRSFVDEIKSNYDYVLIDGMPSLSLMAINSLAAADSVIIPSQPEFLSTQGLDLLMRSISNTKKSINPNLKIDGILFTMVEGRTNDAKEIIYALRSHYGEKIKVFQTEIPRGVGAKRASRMGKSIYAHASNSKVSLAYEGFVKEVLDLERQKDRFRSDGLR